MYDGVYFVNNQWTWLPFSRPSFQTYIYIYIYSPAAQRRRTLSSFLAFHSCIVVPPVSEIAIEYKNSHRASISSLSWYLRAADDVDCELRFCTCAFRHLIAACRSVRPKHKKKHNIKRQKQNTATPPYHLTTIQHRPAWIVCDTLQRRKRVAAKVCPFRSRRATINPLHDTKLGHIQFFRGCARGWVLL